MSGKVKLSKALGLAGKDTIAIILISKGLDFVNEGNYVVGAGSIIAGGLLFLIQQYF
jgi:hypothetical protein